MPDFRKPGTTREQIAQADGTYRQRLDTLREIDAARPWYKRAWHFVTSAAGFLKVFGTIAGVSIGAHAWIAGLVTKDNVRSEVEKAVTAAMLDTHDRVSKLEDKTADFPGWKIDAHDKLTRHETKIEVLEKQHANFESRLDRIRR